MVSKKTPKILLLLSHLIGPVSEPQPAEPVLGRTGGDAVRLTPSLLHLTKRVLPRRADTDVEPGRVEPDISAHDPRQQDIAHLVVDRVVPLQPIFSWTK